MQKYRNAITDLSTAIVATAHMLSESVVGIALAVIGIVSAIPEYIALSTASGDTWLALAVALTGVGSAHTAIRTRSNIMWCIFALHLLVVEGMVFGYEGWSVHMFAPIVTVVGAAVMALAGQHVSAKTKQDKHEEEDRTFAMEQKRLNAEAKRERDRLLAEAKAAKIASGSVSSDVSHGVSDGVSRDTATTGETVPETQQIDKIVRHIQMHGDTGATDIANQAGISRSTFYRRIKDMEKAGIVSRNGSGIKLKG